MPTAFYSDSYTFDLPEGHRFPVEKYGRLRRLLLEEGVLGADDFREASMVSRELLYRVHTRRWVDGFLDGSLTRSEIRRIGLPWSEAFTRRSRASVGGTVAAAEQALVDGISGNLAGGTHHAAADHGEGFCVFNDIVVAATALLEEKRIERVGIVDLDVHQGNGTAALCADDPRFFILDMYGEHNYPYRKVPATLDLPLEDETGDDRYLSLLGEALPRLFSFAPDIIFYLAGVDPLADDALGKLAMTGEGLAARDRMVLQESAHFGAPVVLSLGGGYSRPIDASVRAYAETWKIALEIHSTLID